MNCKKCGSNWNTGQSVSVCPFCGYRLGEGKQEYGIHDAFVKIVESYGHGIFTEMTTFISLLADFAPQYAKERNLIKNALSIGVAKTFLDADGKPDDERKRTILIVRRDLKDRLYLDDNGADLIVTCFTDALHWNVTVDKSMPSPESLAEPENKPRQKTGIQFGDYKWRTLVVQGDKALIITEDVIDQRPYHEKLATATWETCTLRKYLNGEFLQRFTKEQHEKIVETTIGNPNNLWRDAPGGNETRDKVFLLSLQEVDSCFGNSGDYQNKRRKEYDNGKWAAADDGWDLSNAHDSDRLATFGYAGCWWWLRSPGNTNAHAAVVEDDGHVCVHGEIVFHRGVGVRPALWLNLS